jgi:multidrug efflux pump
MFWVPLSQAIVSGLTFSTVLTLVATPAMLALPHQLRASARRLRQRARRDEPQSASVGT